MRRQAATDAGHPTAPGRDATFARPRLATTASGRAIGPMTGIIQWMHIGRGRA